MVEQCLASLARALKSAPAGDTCVLYYISPQGRRLGCSLNGQAQRSDALPGRQVTWEGSRSTSCETKPPRPPTCQGRLNEQALKGNLLGSLLWVSIQGFGRLIPKGVEKHPGTELVETFGPLGITVQQVISRNRPLEPVTDISPFGSATPTRWR